VTALVFLVFFIYSILGVFLFKDIDKGMVIDENNNFKNFTNALILLFRSSTGEDWHLVMFDCAHNFNWGAATGFFISFIVIVQFVMLNLFVLIILD